MTASLLIPLIVAIILWSPTVVFSLIIALVAAGAMQEYCLMAFKGRRVVESRIAMLLAALLVFIFANVSIDIAFFAGITGFIVLAFTFLFRFDSLEKVTIDLAQMVLGIVYIPLLLVHFCWLRMELHGNDWMFLCLMIVMFCDSFAYFTGSAIGKTKLYPQISPKKSVEGSVGGAVGSLVSVFIAKYTFFPELSIVDAVALGLILSSVGQVGDLFESMLKRSFAVKDSGTLIPGHGGLLDRLDSLLFAFPVAYYYSYFIFA